MKRDEFAGKERQYLSLIPDCQIRRLFPNAPFSFLVIGDTYCAPRLGAPIGVTCEKDFARVAACSRQVTRTMLTLGTEMPMTTFMARILVGTGKSGFHNFEWGEDSTFGRAFLR